MTERITEGMTLVDAIEALSEGHQQAKEVLLQVLKYHSADALRVFSCADSRGIYGEGLWILFKYEADENIDTFVGFASHTTCPRKPVTTYTR